MQDSAPPTFVDRPSKSARKRDAHELQSLGEALVELPADRLAALAIGDSLRNAIDEYRRTRSHEGRRRQMQLIGKLMRNEEVEPLREAVADYKLGGARDALALHQAERWRAELVAGDEAVDRWMASHPQSDRQQLRALVRNARKDAGLPPEQRHGRAWRELFQWIKPQLKKSDE
jgi:ribosome-associated protein